MKSKESSFGWKIGTCVSMATAEVFHRWRERAREREMETKEGGGNWIPYSLLFC